MSVLGDDDEAYDDLAGALPLNDPVLAGMMLQQRLADHDDALGILQEQMQQVLRDKAPVEAGGPWEWEQLTPGQKATLLEKVGRFVTFLNNNYLNKNATLRLKPCWWKHPDVLRQVTGIYAAYLTVYNRAAVKASMQQVDFHERALWPTLERIATSQVMKDCSTLKHAVDEADAVPEQGAAEDSDPTAARPRDGGWAKQVEEWRGHADAAYQRDRGDRSRGDRSPVERVWGAGGTGAGGTGAGGASFSFPEADR